MFDPLISERNFLSWSEIASLADNEFVRLASAVPIFGYLILFNDQIVGNLSFLTITGYSGLESSPFFLDGLLKLRLVFFGGLFLFVSNAIFRFRSPKILKFAADDIAFSVRVVSDYSIEEIHALENQVLVPGFRRRTDLINPRSHGAPKDGEYPKMFHGYKDKGSLPSSRKVLLRAVSREWWLNENFKNPISRICALVFASLGYLMLLLPTLDLTQAVLLELLTS